MKFVRDNIIRVLYYYVHPGEGTSGSAAPPLKGWSSEAIFNTFLPVPLVLRYC